MSETMNKVMDEGMTTEEPMDSMAMGPEEEYEGGSGKALAAVLAVGAGVVAAGTVAYKKLKAKKDEKPKKKTKKRLRWVEVPVEDEEFEEDIIDSEAEEVDKSDDEKK